MAGRVDVDEMLRGLTVRQFEEWVDYEQVEPFGAVRENYHAAIVAKTLADIAQAKRQDGKSFTLEDFLLTFEPPAPKQRQSWQEQKMMIETLAYMLSKTE